MERLTAKEEGFTIVEVVVASLVLVMGAFATFGALRAATINTQRAKASQVALDLAQQEIEKLRGLSNKELALATTPTPSTDPLSPSRRISGADFALVREPPSEYKRMVVKGGELYGGGFVEGGAVNPGPTAFTSGDVTGSVYRYVVWRNDDSCPSATCPGSQDYKQIVVAVKLNTPGTQAGARGYVEVQSNFIDPKDSILNDPVPGAEGVVTAQQFFLSDTSCDVDGSTARGEITADHPLHNTLGTCASGTHTGTTFGAPDALLLGAPPDPAPEDEANPLTYDYSGDYPSPPTPETAKGIQLRRDSSSGCNYTPKDTTEPQWRVHRWVTDPMASTFKLSGKVTFDFYSRTINDSLFKGKLCIYLFDRKDISSTQYEDTMLKEKGTSNTFWTYVPPTGNGFWWREGWGEVRKELTFTGTEILKDHRLGIAVSLEKQGTDGDISVLYDHPKYRTRIEVDTTTPLEGG
jgi:type II secretory pathway pseudopilin PulG